MARYKETEKDQGQFVTVNFYEQLIAGSFEYTMSELEENLSREMRIKIDKPKYKKLYSKRLKIIEPVFANITYCKGITRFTLRGSEKVNIQWKLYCMVHILEK